MAISASETRNTLMQQLIRQVNEDGTAVEISATSGSAVLMSLSEYEAWRETAYLFRSPANARRLLDAMDAVDLGPGEVHELHRS